MHFAMQSKNNGTAAAAATFFLVSSDKCSLSANCFQTGVLKTAAARSTRILPEKADAAASSQSAPPVPNICPI